METATLTFEFYNGSTWVDITDDVLYTPPPFWSRGMKRDDPTALVADIGQLEFTLNNSVTNSGSAAGRYSPGHASAVAGFAIGAKVRVYSLYSEATYYQFYGRIAEITPDAGVYRSRQTRVVVNDYINELTNRSLSTLALQTSKRSDQLVTTIIGEMDFAPLNTDYDTGRDTFAIAFHDLRSEKQTFISVMQSIVQSDFSRLYVTGNSTDGETLVLANRHADIGVASSLTLSNTMRGVDVVWGMDDIRNSVVVSLRQPIEGVSNEVLYTLAIEKELGATRSFTFVAKYTDPDGGQRICGNTMVTPVKDTDYKFSSVSGSGTDMNDDLGVTVTFGTDRADVTVTNNSATKTGYLWLFQLRGLALRLRDELEIKEEDSTSISAYGEKKYNYDAPYQSNENTAKDIADFILAKWKNPKKNIDSIRIVGNISAALMTAATSLEIGAVITVTETQTGISETRNVIGYKKTVLPGSILSVEYMTSSTRSGQVWKLGVAGSSELGETTYLIF